MIPRHADVEVAVCPAVGEHSPTGTNMLQDPVGKRLQMDAGPPIHLAAAKIDTVAGVDRLLAVSGRSPP